MGETDQRQNDQFQEQTPQTYKWAVGAGGLVAAASAAISAVKPEIAGYSIGGMIIFILLIFIIISLEAGTSKSNTDDALATNARRQVFALSWFATFSFVVGACTLISSILFQWPLNLSLLEDKTSEKFLRSIKSFDAEQRTIERVNNEYWQECFLKTNQAINKFYQERMDASFLVLHDEVRNVWLQIPIQGGMMQWSVTPKRYNCENEYCWGDVGIMRMVR